MSTLRGVLTSVISSLVFTSVASATLAASYRDDLGHTVEIKTPAKRVITLAPSLTELLYAAGGGHTLVGTVNFSDYPAAAGKVPRIGDYQRLDLETIATLKPDLVLVWRNGNAQRELERLQALGVPLFYIGPQRLEDIPAAIERIGAMVGSAAVARNESRRLREQHAFLRQKYAHAREVRVFYQIATQPLMTINDHHVIADVIRLCSGANVFAQAPMLVPQPSTESVVAANPDVILSARVDAASAALAQRNPQATGFRIWANFQSMSAVRNGHMWTIPADFISRNGPRLFDGARAVCEALQAVRDAN